MSISSSYANIIFEEADKAVKSVDISDVEKYNNLFKDYNETVLNSTIEALSNDIVNPRNIEIAGMLLIHDVVKASKSMRNYLMNYDHRLSVRVKSFMYKHIESYQEFIEKYNMLNYYDHDIFSASTLIKNYTLAPHYGEKTLESPLQLWLRVATHLYCDTDDLQLIFQTALEYALRYRTLASPTLYNGGTTNPQGSSCFLTEFGDDLDSILGTGVRDSGKISQHKGGLGFGLGRIRHSAIKGGGMASGVIPVARILDKLVLYVDQGGSRSGAGTAHLPLWHYDIYDFINSTNNFGQSQVNRLQFLNTCVWIPDLFIRRCSDKNATWTVFCPARAKLFGLYGAEFETKYVEYETMAELREKEYELAREEYETARSNCMRCDESDDDVVSKALRKFMDAQNARIIHKKINANTLFEHLCDVEIKSGFPFVMYGDSINSKSNQSNIGTVNSSNLCVTGDTMIMTAEHGYARIDSLVGNFVSVWNGDFWCSVKPIKTSDSSKIVRVTLSNGMTLDCTEYHKFLINNDGSDIKIKNCNRVEASNLKPGDKLLKFYYPVIKGNKINNIISNETNTPAFNSTYEFKIDWLQSMLDETGSNINVENETFAKNIQLLMTTINISSNVKQLNGMYNISFNNNPNNIEVIDVEYLNKSEATYCFKEEFNNAGVFGGILTSQCVEITEVSTPKTIASCNLTSISLKIFVVRDNLPKFKNELAKYKSSKQYIDSTGFVRANHITSLFNTTGVYNYKMLANMTWSSVQDIEHVISHNMYPVEDKTKPLNMDMRPLGIGVSGFDDAVKALDLLFESEEANALNKSIFACMYYNALYKSSNLAKELGEYNAWKKGSFILESVKTLSEIKAKYPMLSVLEEIDQIKNDEKVHQFRILGSPISNGLYQFDLWKEHSDVLKARGHLSENIYVPEDDRPISPSAWGEESGRNWETLREYITFHGVRHSMLLTCMPTASTGQLLRNAESTEAHGSNLYSRTVKHGSFIVYNQNFHRDFDEIGFYNAHTVDYLKAANGSMKYFMKFVKDYAPKNAYPELTPELTDRIEYLMKKYTTMFEISQKDVLRKARQRGIYIDQSQSTNIYMKDPCVKTMKAVHSFGNKLGLKTGMYYLRQRNAAEGGNFTLSSNLLKFKEEVVDIEELKTNVPRSPPKTTSDEAPMCTLAMRNSGECLACS